MARLIHSRLITAAAAAAAALAVCLAAGGCSGASGAARASAAGAAGLLATPGGVVWSFSPTELSNGVLRSTDSGRDWKVVLSPGRFPSGDLTASYFLGPDRAWVADQQRHAFGKGETTTVLGTSDGGKTWWRSRPLPGDVTACCTDLTDQVYFADARHGWLLAAGALYRPGPAGSASQVMRLWRTADGGRSWLELPPGALPLEGAAWRTVPPECGIDTPQVAFAGTRDGWLTEGACGSGPARPLVWRTGDGGLHWTATALPAPRGGWGVWLGSAEQGGVSVGPPRTVVSAGGGVLVLVPVSTGVGGLVIERSADAGRTWQVASRLETRFGLDVDSQARDWFTVIDARRWVVTGPGELIQTGDAGRRWHVAGYPSGAAGSPASFLSLRRGFVRSYGGLVARLTRDAGRNWVKLPAPAGWPGASAETLGDAITSVQIVSARFAVASGAAGVLVSRDGGFTWRQLPGIAVPVDRTQFLGTTDGFATTAAGRLLRTRDGGKTWQSVADPAGQPVFGAQFWSPADGAAFAAGRIYVTRDGGATWRPVAEPAGWEAGGSFCFARGGVGWQVAAQHHRVGVLVTANTGASRQVALQPPLLRSNDVSSPSIEGCARSNAWVLYTALVPPICTGACGGTYPSTYDLVHTTDLGRTWLDVLRNPAFFNHLGPRPAVPVAAGALQPMLFNRAQSVIFEPLALTPGGSVWVTTEGTEGGHGIGSSADGGLTWVAHDYQLTEGNTTVLPPPVPGGLPGDQVWRATTALDSRHAWVLLTGPDQLSVAGDTSLYATSNGGATWIPITIFG